MFYYLIQQVCLHEETVVSERRVYHVKLVVGESVKDGLMRLGGEEQVAGNSDYERWRAYRLAVVNVVAIDRIQHAQVTICIEALAQFLPRGASDHP